MKQPSNISTIVQKEKTSAKSDHIENLVNKRKELEVGSKKVTEPNSSFEKSIYGKIVVRELQKGNGIVQVIDDNPDSIRIYEIHPNGSYSSKTTENTVEKSSVDAFHIFSGNLQIAIHGDKIEVIKGDQTLCIDGELNIEATQKTGSLTGSIPAEGLVSFSKLKKQLALIIAAGSPIVLPPTFLEETICFDKIKIKQE